MPKIPSASDLIAEATRNLPNPNVNDLHSETYRLMLVYREKYYEDKVDEFLSRLSLLAIPLDEKKLLRKEMLEPIEVGDITYSNFMEEASRRVSQTFQVISGNLAELCAQSELEKVGLRKDVNFTVKKERTDIMVYHLDIFSPKARHRIEVKNVKLRERGTRGLGFDGDSIFGFFDDASEFTSGNVEVIDNYCKDRNGFAYVPPLTLKQMTSKGKYFRPNTQFGKDMLSFVKTGKIV